MLTFHPLELVRRRPIAEDAVCLELRPPPGLETAYRFEAGQHLAVRAMKDSGVSGAKFAALRARSVS